MGTTCMHCWRLVVVQTCPVGNHQHLPRTAPGSPGQFEFNLPRVVPGSPGLNKKHDHARAQPGTTGHFRALRVFLPWAVPGTFCCFAPGQSRAVPGTSCFVLPRAVPGSPGHFLLFCPGQSWALRVLFYPRTVPDSPGHFLSFYPGQPRTLYLFYPGQSRTLRVLFYPDSPCVGLQEITSHSWFSSSFFQNRP